MLLLLITLEDNTQSESYYLCSLLPFRVKIKRSNYLLMLVLFAMILLLVIPIKIT